MMAFASAHASSLLFFPSKELRAPIDGGFLFEQGKHLKPRCCERWSETSSRVGGSVSRAHRGNTSSFEPSSCLAIAA